MRYIKFAAALLVITIGPQKGLLAQTKTAADDFKPVVSQLKSVPYAGFQDASGVSTDFSPVLQHMGIYHPQTQKPGVEIQRGPGPEKAYDIVEERDVRAKDVQVESPTLVRQFAGFSDNAYTPPDNSIAISNGGIVLSAMNSNFRTFKYSGGIPTQTYSYYDFFSSKFPELKSTYFDPRVVYDPYNDRFIMVVLHGNTSTTNKIMVMFSKTNNPKDGWHLYMLPGDPLNKGHWTDYPAIAVSESELYITGNLFENMYFDGTVLHQIDKNAGYSGSGSLNFRTHSNLTMGGNNELAFSLVPVSHGLGKDLGADIYFLAHRLNYGSDVALFKLSNTLAQGGTPTLTRRDFSYGVNTYSRPYEAPQRGSSIEVLNAGDTRIKQAFIQDGIIHYVYSTYSSKHGGAAGIGYGRINTRTNTLNATVLGALGIHYCYPSVASLASMNNEQERTVLIAYQRSSSGLYPELGSVSVGGDGNVFDISPNRQIYAGNSYVNVMSSESVERWGDYTGLARLYNGNSCFFAGAFANGGVWSTRIAELGLSSNRVSIREPEVSTAGQEATIYPNPATDRFAMKFGLPDGGNVIIRLYDAQGKLMHILFDGWQKPGDKEFSFTTGSLTSGLYMVELIIDGKQATTKRVVVK